MLNERRPGRGQSERHLSRSYRLNSDRRSLAPRTIYLAAALGVTLILCLALTICFAASPRPPKLDLPAVAISDAAAQTAEDKVMKIADAPLGPFTLDLSDAEISSWLALRLPGSPFLNPQVHLTDGKVYITGDVSLGVPLKVVSLWSVTQDNNRPRILVERTAFGPFALAPVLLNSVSATINEMIDESGTGVFPSAVTISDGHIIIAGRKSEPAIP
jgi:hypothetical protein